MQCVNHPKVNSGTRNMNHAPCPNDATIVLISTSEDEFPVCDSCHGRILRNKGARTFFPYSEKVVK